MGEGGAQDVSLTLEPRDKGCPAGRPVTHFFLQLLQVEPVPEVGGGDSDAWGLVSRVMGWAKEV